MADTKDTVPSAGAGEGEGAAGAETCDDLKKQGNALFLAAKYEESIVKYTEAAKLDGTNHLVFGNRSAAHLKLGNAEAALADAVTAVTLNKSWVKGYLRQGQALMALDRFRDAEAVFQAAKRIDSKSTLAGKLLAEATEAAAKYDRDTPVTSLDQWKSVFQHLTDVRQRLGTLATFWNDASRKERLKVFRDFFKSVIGSGGGISPTEFTEEQMVGLPMTNYPDLVVPDTWLTYYRSLGVEDKVQLFYTIWDLCSDDEKGLIIGDIQFFFPPPADDEGEDGAGDSDTKA